MLANNLRLLKVIKLACSEPLTIYQAHFGELSRLNSYNLQKGPVGYSIVPKTWGITPKKVNKLSIENIKL